MRVRRLVAGVVLVPVAALALLEVALRIEGVVRTPATARPPDGMDVVLCVGDSHTRGLPDPDNVPFHLQRLLDAHARRPHRVVNLGVPGLMTGQLRARLPRWVDYYRPAVIVFWVGVNNGWRQNEPPWRRRGIARLGDHSRAVQVLRLIHFVGGLRFTRLETDGFEATDWRGIHAVWRADFAGTREDVNTEPGDALPADVVEATVRDDLRAMMVDARARGIRVYALTYELPGASFGAANRGVSAVLRELGAPSLDAVALVDRLLKEAPREPLFDASMHPTAYLYRHVAEAAYRMLAADGAFGPTSQ